MGNSRYKKQWVMSHICSCLFGAIRIKIRYTEFRRHVVHAASRLAGHRKLFGCFIVGTTRDSGPGCHLRGDVCSTRRRPCTVGAAWPGTCKWAAAATLPGSGRTVHATSHAFKQDEMVPAETTGRCHDVGSCHWHPSNVLLSSKVEKACVHGVAYIHASDLRTCPSPAP